MEEWNLQHLIDLQWPEEIKKFLRLRNSQNTKQRLFFMDQILNKSVKVQSLNCEWKGDKPQPNLQMQF